MNCEGGMNSIRFNQDNSCFVCAFDGGFILFNSDPLKQIFRVDLEQSIRLAEPLFRSSTFALLGSDVNKVLLFDCFVNKIVVELDVRTAIKNVLLRRDRILVAAESCILVYTLTDIPERLCAISHTDSNPILVFLSKSIGHIGILSLHNPQRRIRTFKAHKHALQTISVDSSGSLLATASSKGTLINVFDLQTTNLLYKFRRGLSNATISCIKFSADSSAILLQATTERTVHIFKLDGPTQQNQSFIERHFKRHSGYVRLYANYLSDQNKISNTQCAFVGGCSVAVVDLDSNYYKFDVDIGRMCCLEWSHSSLLTKTGRILKTLNEES